VTFLCLVVAYAGTLIDRVPPRARAQVNPSTSDERSERAGAKLYKRECANCHGADGRGSSKAPPLNHVATAPPGSLFWVLRNGSLRRGMPSFAHLPEQQRWQIIDYLRTLK
jgi:mono/diheme cytochrome c family protein